MATDDYQKRTAWFNQARFGMFIHWGLYSVRSRAGQRFHLNQNRGGLDEDLDTPEQMIKASGTGRAWESCMTIGDTWGHIKYNPNTKPATLTGVKNKILAAKILTTGQPVEFRQADHGKVFLTGLPEKPPDFRSTVLALKLDGKSKSCSYEGIPL